MSLDGKVIIMFGLLVYIVVKGFLFAIKQKQKSPTMWFMKLIRFMFVLYLLMVVSVTLFPLEIGGYHEAFSYRSINFIPLISIVRDIGQVGTAYGGDSAFMIMLIVRNVGGNILMFMPLGFLAPLLSQRFKNLKKIILTALFVSLSIESLQFGELLFSLGLGRAVDIDDVICNVSGATLGFLIYQLMISFLGKRKVSAILVKYIEK